VVHQIALAILIALAALSAPAAEARDPTVLDTQRVNNREERVVFRIDRRYAHAEELRLRAGDQGMLVRAIEIKYAGGERRSIDFLDRLEAGHESRPLPLAASGRPLEEIIVWKRPTVRPGEGTLQLVGVVPDRGG
jgi:hypothetical protein